VRTSADSSDPDDEYKALLPFIKEGLERGERAFHVVDPELRETHLRRLAALEFEIREH